MNEAGALTIVERAPGALTAKQESVDNAERKFALICRQAKAYADSELVPKEYRGKVANCIIALELADRIGASALMVMQNLAIIHGRPSWSSTFIISAINSCGRFKPIRFRLIPEEKERDLSYEIFENDFSNGSKTTKVVKKTNRILNKTCVAWTMDSSGEVLESPMISIEMACLEGWFDKSGSKWRTMPDLMLRYRAAAFFGRLYAPDILMGMHTSDEVEDFRVVEGGDFDQARQQQPAQTAAAAAEPIISKDQAREFGAAYKTSGYVAAEAKDFCQVTFGVDSTLKIPAARFEEAIAWAKTPKPTPAEQSPEEKVAREAAAILDWKPEEIEAAFKVEGSWAALNAKLSAEVDRLSEEGQ